MAELSVVLITKNQQWNIARLIESVLKHTSVVDPREIVLVDSASSDSTIEVARRYPIRIIRLHPDQHLTAAAGRYIGYQHTTGDLILFLDGDMELCEGWFNSALEVFQQTPDMAVLTGYVVDVPKKVTSGMAATTLSAYNHADEITELTHGGGAALYRRSVLEEVGPFNPYLYSDEEPELCLRIRRANYRVARIERPIALHYTDPRHKLTSLWDRRKRNLYLGFGQNIRYHASTGLVWAYIRERRFALLPAAGLLTGFASLLWFSVCRQILWFNLWIMAVITTILLDALRKRSLYKSTHSLLNRLLIIEGSIRGMLHTISEPDEYPGRFDIIQ